MIIRVSNTICEIEKETNDKESHHRQLKNFLTTKGPGFQFTGMYKVFKKTRGKHGWNGDVNLLTHNTFATGLLPKVVEFLEKKTKNITIEDNRFIKPLKLAKTTKVKLRDYQLEAIQAALKNTWKGLWFPRGVLQISTGGGKTETAIAMVEMMPNVPTLFLVHRKDLLHQTAKRFEEYGIKVSIIGDGKWETSNITIATIQSLLSKKTEKDPSRLDFLKEIEQVFFDECHHIAATVQKGNTFVHLSNLLPNAYMRWGLTATPFMKDEYSNLLLEGASGSVLYTKSSTELIKEGYLTPPKIKMITTAKDMDIPNDWPDCYTMGIVYNKDRNLRIVEEACNAKAPVLILVQQVRHGKNLLNIFKEKNVKVTMLSGEDDSSVRITGMDMMKKGELDILISTTIFDEGIDIPSIQTLILAGAGKSLIKGIQRLGRGLRKAEGKVELSVIDFYDYITNKLRLHSHMRMSLYEDQGFHVDKSP